MPRDQIVIIMKEQLDPGTTFRANFIVVFESSKMASRILMESGNYYVQATEDEWVDALCKDPKKYTHYHLRGDAKLDPDHEINRSLYFSDKMGLYYLIQWIEKVKPNTFIYRTNFRYRGHVSNHCSCSPEVFRETFQHQEIDAMHHTVKVKHM